MVIFCSQDFQRLGGRVGNQAMATLEDIDRQRQARICYMESKVAASLAALVDEFRVVLAAKDVDSTVGILALFSKAMGCDRENRGSYTFVKEGGIQLVLKSMKTNQGSLEIQHYALRTLHSLVCRDRQEEAFRCENASLMLREGILDHIRRVIEKQTESPDDCDEMAYFVGISCDVISNITVRNDYFNDHLHDFRLLTQAFVSLMEESRDSPRLLSFCMHSFAILIDESAPTDDRAALQRESVKTGSAQACVKAMQSHPESAFVQHSGGLVLAHLIGKESLMTMVEVDCIQAISEAMNNHQDDPFIQARAFDFIGNVVNSCNGDELLIRPFREHKIVQRVKDVVSNHSESLVRPAAAAKVLSTIAKGLKPLQIDIAHSGIFDSYADVLRESRDTVQDFGYILAALNVLLGYMIVDNHNPSVRLALCKSYLIPAIVGDGKFENDGNSTLLGKLPCISMGLGIVDLCERDGDDFDDVEFAKYPVQSPPFDVHQILNMDLLTTSTLGWYQGMPFYVATRSIDLMKKHDGSKFLYASSTPCVNLEVCIRVRLPFGGRGYLYGKVTSVQFPPMSGEPFPDDQRCLADGQEVTASVSLDSQHFERKARYGPLPEFFLDEKTKYDVILRWDASKEDWIVKRLSLRND
ncbi:MAG: hypothetical protein SGILL_001022 [Bacillariaceae sp.]